MSKKSVAPDKPAPDVMNEEQPTRESTAIDETGTVCQLTASMERQLLYEQPLLALDVYGTFRPVRSLGTPAGVPKGLEHFVARCPSTGFPLMSHAPLPTEEASRQHHVLRHLARARRRL